METHPVPQNVTSFEFHLIGDMTLKQFIYLAVGLATAYVTYIFFFQAAPYVAVPIIVISTILGTAFAFLPIQDRPLDHWAGAFFRAVYSPTQRKWKIPFSKKQAPINQDLLFKNRLQVYLHQIQVSRPTVEAPSLPSRPVKSVLQEKAASAKVAIPLISPTQDINQTIPTDDTLTKTVALAKEAQAIQQQILQTEKQMDYLKTESAKPGVPPGAYAADLQKVFDNLQTLISNAQKVSTQLAEISGEPIQKHTPSEVQPAPAAPAAPTTVAAAPATVKPKQRILPKLTSSPNVINGIVTDAEGNYIENVVVVIHNQEGLPVRALKTNKLGQFTGTTPLPTGAYTLSLEKDPLEFDTLKVTLNDQVLAPMEISAKKGAAVVG